MMNRQHSRLLTTVVLLAAMSLALGSEAFAAGSARTPLSATSGLKFAKPGSGPMAGEPDAGGGTLPPPPPKVNPTLSSSGTGPTGWLLRYHWSLRILLLQLPKRFP